MEASYTESLQLDMLTLDTRLDITEVKDRTGTTTYTVTLILATPVKQMLYLVQRKQDRHAQ